MLINEVGKIVKELNEKLQNPENYHEADNAAIITGFEHILQLLTQSTSDNPLPISLMYDMYQLNLFVLAAGTKNTFQLHSNYQVQAVFKYFGKIHREIVEEMHLISDAADDFNHFVEKKVHEIREVVNADSKTMQLNHKQAIITREYAFLFNQINVFIMTNHLSHDAAIGYLKLDDDIVQSDPPLMSSALLTIRHHESSQHEIGKIIHHLHKHAKKSHHIERFFTLFNKHFDELHQAYELAKKCDAGGKDPEDNAKLVKYWLMALRKVNLLKASVPEFKLYADNQIRIIAIKFGMNCPALANNAEIEAETKKMEPQFGEFKETLATNQKLLAEISAFINGKTEDAEGWIHIMTNLKTGNERPQFTLSSEYIFELLKTDISFVSSDKIVTAEAKEHRKELLKDIRHALDSVFVFSRKDRTTVLKKEFEDHLKAFNASLSFGKLKEVQETLKITTEDIVKKLKDKWMHCEVLLTYYAPYLVGFEATMPAQKILVEAHNRIAKWEVFKLDAYKKDIGGMELNQKIIEAMRDIYNPPKAGAKAAPKEKAASKGKSKALKKGAEDDEEADEEAEEEEEKEESVIPSTSCESIVHVYNIARIEHSLHGITLSRNFRVKLAQVEKSIRDKKVCRMTGTQDAEIHSYHHAMHA